MEDMTYDVVVVGGGPGGSTTARFLAEGGASVLMIEKRQEIGSPVRCGEGIARIWLDEIEMEPDESWIANQVDGAYIISPCGNKCLLDEKQAGNECGYVVERDIFDRALARAAAEAGGAGAAAEERVEPGRRGHGKGERADASG